MKTTEEKKQRAIEKRNELKALSRRFQQQRKLTGDTRRINEMLIEYYQEEKGVTELKTFDEWRALGLMVKRGETSYLVWAKPQKMGQPSADETEDDDNGNSFYPICHLFDRSQCYDPKTAKAE